jgi:hypothetical protein
MNRNKRDAERRRETQRDAERRRETQRDAERRDESRLYKSYELKSKLLIPNF